MTEEKYVYIIKNIWRDGPGTFITEGNGDIMTFEDFDKAETFRKTWANSTSEVQEVKQP